MDTTSSTGKLLLGVLASIAEFEADIRRERQREGIDRAKAAGVYKGRKPTVDAGAVRALKEEGLGVARSPSASGSAAPACIAPWEGSAALRRSSALCKKKS